MLKPLFGSRVPGLVIGLVVVVAVAESAYLGVRYLQTPWARVHDGHPPLVGYWLGEMTFEPGDIRRVALHLREFETAREFLLRGGKADWNSAPSPDLKVAARVCGSKIRARYHGDGRVTNREATRFTFGLTPETQVLGEHPSSLDGVWDGGDRLELTSRVSAQEANGVSATATASARPSVSDRTAGIRFAMRRTTEAVFNAAC